MYPALSSNWQNAQTTSSFCLNYSQATGTTLKKLAQKKIFVLLVSSAGCLSWGELRIYCISVGGNTERESLGAVMTMTCSRGSESICLAMADFFWR